MVAKKNTETRKNSHADSMEAAAARIGCGLADLKRAKAAGCDGFVHGRVHIERVRKWLQDHAPDPEDMDKEALECRRLLAQCEKLEFQLAAERRNYLLRADVIADHIRIGHAVRSGVQRIRADAPTWAGLESHQIEKRVDGLLDQVCADLHDATSKLYA